jgi:hypothetical protein
MNADVPGSTNQSKEQNRINLINNIPKSVVRLENLYDLQDNFKKVTNCKTNISSMQFEVINLGTNNTPQNINLERIVPLEERQAFIKLFKEYKDIFSWTYDDLKTYDTNIIQHVIPMKLQTNPFQKS